MANNNSVALVSVKADGSLFVPEEACVALNAMQHPLAVVAIAGKYRSGKSTLISRLIGRKGAFKVGHSVRSCTKGIMAHKLALTVAGGQRVLVLDSEGLNALDSNIQHDVRIFALSVLLSSVFLYNVQNTLDEAALNSIKVVTDFATMMCATGTDTAESLAAEMPMFAAVVRDFSLKLDRADGTKMSPDEWLEDALQTHRDDNGAASNAEQVSDKGEVRRAIRQLFPQRRCFTLPRPANDEHTMGRMDTAEDKDLRPEFLRGIGDIQKQVVAGAPIKTVMGEKVTGPGLLRVTQQLVAAINDARAPQIRESWALLAELKGRDLVEKLTAQVGHVTAKWHDSPKPLVDIERAMRKLMQDMQDTFSKQVPNRPELLAKLASNHEAQMVQVLANARASRAAACDALLQSKVLQAKELALEAEHDDGGKLGELWPQRLRAVGVAEGEISTKQADLDIDDGGGWVREYRARLLAQVSTLCTSIVRRGAGGVPRARVEELEARLETANSQHQVEVDEMQSKVERLLQSADDEHNMAMTREREGFTLQTTQQEDRHHKLQAEHSATLAELQGARDDRDVVLRQLEELREGQQQSVAVGAQLEQQTIELSEVRLRLEDAVAEQDRCMQQLAECEAQRAKGEESLKAEVAELQMQAEKRIRHKLEQGTKEKQSLEAELRNSKADALAIRGQLGSQKQESDIAVRELTRQLEARNDDVRNKQNILEEAQQREHDTRKESRQQLEHQRKQVLDMVKQNKLDAAEAYSNHQAVEGKCRERCSDLELHAKKLEMLNQNGKRTLERCHEMEQENKRLREVCEQERILAARSVAENSALRKTLDTKHQEITELRSSLQQSANEKSQVKCSLAVAETKASFYANINELG